MSCALRSILAAGALALPAGAFAAPINYGDIPGATVTYVQVTEDSGTDPGTALFGAPNVTGDTIDFDPIFSASAAGAGGVDLKDGQLLFDIVADPGASISEIVLTESGDVTLGGFGTDATFASVTANVFVEIFQVDGVDISELNLLPAALVFTPSDGDYRLGTDGGGGPLYNSSWSGSLTIDLEQALIDAGIPFVDGATGVSVVLDNTLLALSENGTTSFIAKKDTDGLAVTALPEPGASALLWLAGLLFIRRR